MSRRAIQRRTSTSLAFLPMVRKYNRTSATDNFPSLSASIRSNTWVIIFICACWAAVAPRRKSDTAAYAGFVVADMVASLAGLVLEGEVALAPLLLSFLGSKEVRICLDRSASAPAAVPTVWPSPRGPPVVASG